MTSYRCYRVAPESNLNDGAKYRILYHSILFFFKQPIGMIGNARKTQISKIKIKLYHVKILVPKSSSGDLYWIENQYVKVSMYLKKVTKTNIHHIMSVCWVL